MGILQPYDGSTLTNFPNSHGFDMDTKPPSAFPPTSFQQSDYPGGYANGDTMLGTPFFPPLSLKPNAKLPRDGWTQDQDNLLMTLKQAGLPYSNISEAIKTQLGADITENRLAKRFNKIREHYFDVRWGSQHTKMTLGIGTNRSSVF